MHLRVEPDKVTQLEAIPFLPIEFFKSKKIRSSSAEVQAIFTSSGTTGATTSQHFVSSLDHYEKCFVTAFELYYGPVSDYCLLALLPSYLERQGSSLIYMVDALIKRSDHQTSGFYLNNHDELFQTLQELERIGQKTLLIGVSFALLDFVETFKLNLNNTIIMETGGMKGRRQELIRAELHHYLQKGFGVDHIHSEYGMTELLSQAYSHGEGLFHCPPWMKVFARDTEDPLSLQKYGKTGGLNIIDLANYNSCAFIATQDLGKVYQNGSFEVLGRFDHADVRGCNLMVV